MAFYSLIIARLTAKRIPGKKHEELQDLKHNPSGPLALAILEAGLCSRRKDIETGVLES